MKQVAINDAERNLKELVAEIDSTGDEVVITRDGLPIARLVAATQAAQVIEMTRAQVERRRQAAIKLQEIARDLNLEATHQEIKSWINEGRH